MLQNDSVKLSVMFGEPVDQLRCGKLKSPVTIKFYTAVETSERHIATDLVNFVYYPTGFV